MDKRAANELKVFALVCSLKPSPAESSSQLLAGQLLGEFDKLGASSELVRTVDYDIKPGVEADMGEGDDWPDLRQKMLESDIFIMATPTWVGHMSSVAQRIIERLDAELSDTDEAGRMRTYGKCAAAVIVGNEDGAHKITADLYQALNDVGFSLAAGAVVYWNGEAMHTTDYKDLSTTPDKVATTIKSLVLNTAHLANLLRDNPYPPQK